MQTGDGVATSAADAQQLNNRGGRKQSLDMPAALAFIAALFSLQMGVTWGLLHSWTISATIALLALTPFLLLLFVIWELRYSKYPIIYLSLFSRNRAFSGSIATALLQSLALYSINLLLVQYKRESITFAVGKSIRVYLYTSVVMKTVRDVRLEIMGLNVE